MGACMDPPCIVMELMEGGSLYNMLHKEQVKLELTTIKTLAIDILRGLIFLHSCKPPIIHRDLKSNNILLDAERQHAKIADFGLATFKKDTAPHTVCGTPTHMAPEVRHTLMICTYHIILQ